MYLPHRAMRVIGSLLAASAIGLLVPMTALAAEVQSGDSVTIGPNQMITDDLYVVGTNVLIQGTVQGDVIAAGTTVTISGHVTGNVMAAGSTVNVSGPVDGSVRIAGSELMLTAPVAGDALMAGSTATISNPARVGRDALLAGATINVQSPIARDVKAAGSRLTLGSNVGGGVTANVDQLVLGDAAVVGGPVAYVSSHDAVVAPSATVGGAIQRTPPVTTTNPWEVAGIDLLALVRGFIGLTVLGLALVIAFPRTAAETYSLLRARWAASIGLGFAVLVGTPVLALGVFLIGLLVGGWWIALLLLGLCAMLSLVGYLATAEWLGLSALRAAQAAPHPVWAMVIGVFLLSVVGLIPVLGGILLLGATVFGVGGLVLEASQRYRSAPRAETVPAVAAGEPTRLVAAA